MLDRNLFKISLLLIIIIEALSFVVYQGLPAIQPIFLGVTLIAFTIISWRSLEYGLLIIFAELFVSSFGHLFQVDLGAIKFSLRMGFFTIFQAIYGIHLLRTRTMPFRRSRYFWPNLCLFGAIIISFAVAFWNGNATENILHDADSYAFFAYFPAVYEIFRNRASQLRLLTVGAASLAWLGIQTALILFIFSHRLREPMRLLYLWIRDARIGEITLVAGDFYRIFFQSYVFALIAIFFIMSLLLRHSRESGNPLHGSLGLPGPLGPRSGHNGQGRPRMTGLLWLFIIAFFLILTSFSRSFWFGCLIGSVVLFITFFKFRIPWSQIWKRGLQLVGGIGIALSLIFVIVNFPLPPKGPPILLADLFRGRAFALFDEAAASSRWELLPAMWQEIKHSPILGAGFGKTIIYESKDPRIIAETGGTYTTFAFEWNYLDIWLKLGLLGILAYGWLIIRILRQGWDTIQKLPVTDYQLPIIHGLWLGLIALLAANVFTPYLNHPLGIGAVMLFAVFFEQEFG